MESKEGEYGLRIYIKEAGRIAIIGSPPGFSITSLQFLPLKQQIRTHDQLVKGSNYIFWWSIGGSNP